MSFEHSVGMVEVRGGDVGQEYSFLPVLSVECTFFYCKTTSQRRFFPL